MNSLTAYRLSRPIGDLTLVLFMTSGYTLLLFRDSFIPLSRRLRIGALALGVAATGFALTVGEAQPVANKALGLTGPVSTGACTA